MGSLGERIKQVRRVSGLKQKGFAEAILVSPSYVSRLEHDAEEPSPKVLRLICVEFGVNIDWLISGKGEPYIKKEEDKKVDSILYTDIKHTEESSKTRLDMLQAQFKVLSDASLGARDGELSGITTAMIELDKYLRTFEHHFEINLNFNEPNKVDFLSDSITKAEKTRTEAEKAVKDYAQKENEE